MQTTAVTRMWARKGSAPKVKSAPGRRSIAYSGYVIPETGELLMTKPGWFTYETVIASIRELMQMRPLEKGQKFVLVLDNAPWHKKAIRLIWKEKHSDYADIRESVDYLSLPSYSPDLNPIEQCWRTTRREVTHNRYFGTLDDLQSKLDGYFEQWRTPNQKFASLCTFKS